MAVAVLAERKGIGRMEASRRLVVFTALSTMSFSKLAKAQTPDIDTAVVAIDSAIQSLIATPNQFSLQVSCPNFPISKGSVRDQASALAQKTRGAVIFTTTNQYSIAAAEVADNFVKQQSDQAIQLLTEIRAELQASKRDQSIILSKLSNLANTYVPPVAKAVIEAVVKKALYM